MRSTSRERKSSRRTTRRSRAWKPCKRPISRRALRDVPRRDSSFIVRRSDSGFLRRSRREIMRASAAGDSRIASA